MEEWLRCNTCFQCIKDSSHAFYLTECVHVFCSHCVDGAAKQCPECDSVGAGIIPVQETSSQQTTSSVKSVSSHTKVLIEGPQFCRDQYLILSRYVEEKDKAYDKLAKSTERLIESAKLSLLLQKRLKKNLTKYRRRPIDATPPMRKERIVPMARTPTFDILSNNAPSQVSGSRELPLKSTHDHPSQAEPKSKYFSENAHQNGTEAPQSSIYDYPQSVERKSEYVPKNSQPQLDELNSEYSSKKFQPCHQSSIKRANPCNPSCISKKSRVHENIFSKPICPYPQAQRLPTQCSSLSAQSCTYHSRSLIDTPSLNYGQGKNCAVKFYLPNLQPAGAQLQNLHQHYNHLIPPIDHRVQQYRTMAYAPENTEYPARPIIKQPEVVQTMYGQTLYLCDR